jgi:hypothetical protein
LKGIEIQINSITAERLLLRCYNKPPPLINVRRCAELAKEFAAAMRTRKLILKLLEEVEFWIAVKCHGLESAAVPHRSNVLAAKSDAIETASQEVCVVNSWDPNDKVGSQGAGSQHAVRADSRLGYVIHFENEKSATASAQGILISDQLPAELDWSSAFFGEIVLGDVKIHGASGTKHFNGFADLRPAQNVLLLIEADISIETGRVTWSFAGLDPATGQAPQDPLVGILPPNTEEGNGEGSVSLSVRPRAIASGTTVIRNSATILFDSNPAISTPVWTNVLDKQSPVCNVAALPPKSKAGALPLQWSATDEGAGVDTYSVYVSTDNGAYAPVLTNTAVTATAFATSVGHTYAFYCVARDKLGNAQSQPSTADATTTSESTEESHGGGTIGLWTIIFLLTGLGLQIRVRQISIGDIARVRRR